MNEEDIKINATEITEQPAPEAGNDSGPGSDDTGTNATPADMEPALEKHGEPSYSGSSDGNAGGQAEQGDAGKSEDDLQSQSDPEPAADENNPGGPDGLKLNIPASAPTPVKADADDHLESLKEQLADLGIHSGYELAEDKEGVKHWNFVAWVEQQEHTISSSFRVALDETEAKIKHIYDEAVAVLKKEIK